MTIEELRVKYSELEKSHNELTDKYEAQAKEIETLTKEREELQGYNRKLFNEYVLSKEEPTKDQEPKGKTLDDLAKEFKSKFEK